MRNVLPGLKTNITTVLLALIPLAGLFGFQIDPEAVTQFVDEFGEWVMAGQVLLGGLGVWFRELGKP